MGYTHYYSHETIPADKFAAFVEDVEKIIAASEVKLAGWDGTGEPTITPEEIRFNGVASESCETFFLAPPAGRDFTKTQRLPYDEIVTAILLRGFAVLNFNIDSDGDEFEHDWESGIALYTMAFGEEPKNPMEED